MSCSGGARHRMGRWRARWEWGAMEVGENDEFIPEKVMSGVPAGHPSGDPRKANFFFY